VRTVPLAGIRPVAEPWADRDVRVPSRGSVPAWLARPLVRRIAFDSGSIFNGRSTGNCNRVGETAGQPG
jgi:hypothetical protein